MPRDDASGPSVNRLPTGSNRRVEELLYIRNLHLNAPSAVRRKDFQDKIIRTNKFCAVRFWF